MKFPPEFLDEIKARLPASQVIGQRVKLKKQGREWRGLSPFNAEKTPSFYVNDQKQFFHDFSSGKSGDIFNFLIETEGLSFPEAVERLAREAGLDLPRRDAADRRRASRPAPACTRCWRSPPTISSAASTSRSGARARGYLADRRIDARRAARFQARLRGRREIRPARGAGSQGRRRRRR